MDPAYRRDVAYAGAGRRARGARRRHGATGLPCSRCARRLGLPVTGEPALRRSCEQDSPAALGSPRRGNRRARRLGFALTGEPGCRGARVPEFAEVRQPVSRRGNRRARRLGFALTGEPVCRGARVHDFAELVHPVSRPTCLPGGQQPGGHSPPDGYVATATRGTPDRASGVYPARSATASPSATEARREWRVPTRRRSRWPSGERPIGCPPRAHGSR